MYHYALQNCARGMWSPKMFVRKADALAELDRVWLMSEDDCFVVLQGNFTKSPLGYVRQHGRAFAVAGKAGMK